MGTLFTGVNNIGSLSEKKVIARIRANFGSVMPPSPYGAGDDCAVIEKSALQTHVYATTDAVIYGRHFDDSSTAEAAGAKLFKRNASDIASMGGAPFSALTSSIFSKTLSLEWLDGFCAGLAQAAQRYETKLIGGDLARVDFDFFSMHLAMLGHSENRPLTRIGGDVGDWLFTTGSLGRSFESGHHLTFEPRVAEGQWLARQDSVVACTDISDGIASDLKNMLSQNLCASLDVSSIPLRRYGEEVATLEQALCDGEDYELLIAVRGDSADFEKAYFDKFGREIYKIGQIKKASSSIEENAVVVVENSVERVFFKSGFDHSA